MREIEKLKKRAEELREQINYHNYRYYVLYSPVFSDGVAPTRCVGESGVISSG